MNYKQIQTEKYKSFESRNQQWREGQERFIKKHFSSVLKDKVILDLGCGDGVGLMYFKNLGFQKVIGLEFCHEKAQKAATYGYPIFEIDMHEIDDFIIPDETIDIVYSSHSLEHAHNPLIVLRHIHRILKQTGTVFLILPYPDIGPLDAHCGKILLETDKLDEGKALVNVLNRNGFSVLQKSFDSFREPEIWLRLQKL